MNICKICGQPCGIYDICRECQKDLESSKISICNLCGSYYINEKGCNCNKSDKTNTSKKEEDNTKKQEQNINVEVNTTEDNEGCMSWFGKGFGGGCGCLVAIILGLIILGAIGISQFQNIF
ncbi:MAG: hypothetical protein IKB02_04895 [Clostridia bacterium]|nr:hypothetical protein [Clostridia bacterium]MBR6582715.1 hypothetical protein [Treponema sp.]